MNYVFTNTTSGDRTNIMSSFPLWNKEMFIADIKKGDHSGRYRYGKIGGYMNLLKEMSLQEFNEVFSLNTFTTEEITSLFRKEISLVYGEHAEKAKIKPLSKKDLERGCVYRDFSGVEFLYLGEVEETTDKTYKKLYSSEKKPLEVEKGYGFSWYYQGMKIGNNINILKSPKRLMEKVADIKLNLEPEYNLEITKSFYVKEYWKITLRLL